VGESSAVVRADESAVRQIVENLISNAVAHTRPGTEVEVEVSSCPTSGLLVVEVRDRGPGIAVEDLPILFERYRKGAHGEGAGLARAACRELLELPGGASWASPRPGGGAIFSFALPTDSARAYNARRVLAAGASGPDRVHWRSAL